MSAAAPHTSGVGKRARLKRRGFPADEALARVLLERAKASNRTLSETEVLEMVRAEGTPIPARARAGA